MEEPSLWTKILLGVAALLMLFWFLPGARASLARSRQATQRDWRGVLLPLGLVMLFVIFLISQVR